MRPRRAPRASPRGAPGVESYFDLARKDCVGTARNTSSKVWFTVADGVLSDTYWPTVDATNVHTLQYLVTDGHSFTDLQTRDMSYRVVPGRTGVARHGAQPDAGAGRAAGRDRALDRDGGLVAAAPDSARHRLCAER